jgi:alkylhydroperoxidase family enzyme
MAFITTTRPNDASGEVLEMYERQQAHWGYIPDYAKVFSHRPEAMARWGRLLAELRRPVDDYRFELVTLTAALELRHSACSLAHGKKLADMIGDDAVIAIAEGRESEVLSEEDTAIVGYARGIIRNARKINSGQVEALRSKHGLSDEEIFDIAAIVSARSFFSKVLDAVGSEPDVSFMTMNEALRQTLTVGRPISHRRLERLEREDKAPSRAA